MTFEEALISKHENHPDYINEKGQEKRHFVAPKNAPYIDEWLIDFNNDFTDETSKKYCKDGVYWVYWKLIG